MSDVSIKFDGDWSALNQKVAQIAGVGRKTAEAVQKPFDQILESEKRVERSMGSLTKSIAAAATPAEALAGIFDNLENSINGSLAVGVAAAIGMALNQALNEAAKGMEAFSSKIEKAMKAPFEGTTAELDRMRSVIDDLASDKQDDGLFERLIFGGQKEELIASQEKALELAQRLVALKKEAESGEALTQSSRRTRADRLKFGDYDTNTFAGAEDKMRANEEASWIELQLKQYEELKKAQAEYDKLLQDKTSTEMAKANYAGILEQVKERQQLEADSLENDIRAARERRSLDRELADQQRQNAIEQLAFMTEREKLHMNLEHAEKNLNILLDSRAAKEEEIKNAKFAQLKAAADLEAWALKELGTYADITKIQLERQQIGKSALDQQQFRVRMLETEAAELEGVADKAKEYEQKLTQLAEERLKLKEAEREEEEKLRSIQQERIQMAERDPYLRAQNEANWAQERANEIASRPGASESEKQQANLDAEIARQGMLNAATGLAPSLSQIAGTDPDSMEALSRAANRGGLSPYMDARQAQARYALAEAQRAQAPYDPAARARSAKTKRQADIQSAQAKGLVGRDALELQKLRDMDDNEFQDEIDNRTNRAEQKAREAEKTAAEERDAQDHPLDAYKKENKIGTGEEEPEEDPKRVGAHEMAAAEKGEKSDPMQDILNKVSNIDSNLAKIEPKLPQHVLS